MLRHLARGRRHTTSRKGCRGIATGRRATCGPTSPCTNRNAPSPVMRAMDPAAQADGAPTRPARVAMRWTGEPFGVSRCLAARSDHAPGLRSGSWSRVIIRDMHGVSHPPHQTPEQASVELQAFRKDALHGGPQGTPTACSDPDGIAIRGKRPSTSGWARAWTTEATVPERMPQWLARVAAAQGRRALGKRVPETAAAAWRSQRARTWLRPGPGWGSGQGQA